MAELYYEKTKVMAKRAKSETVWLTEQQEQLLGEREKLKDLKVRLYEEYRSGGTKEEYLRKKNEADERLV